MDRIALANIDQVIKIIRASKDPKEAKDRLVAEVSMTRSALEKFVGGSMSPAGEKGKPSDVLRLDDTQAQAILDMRLQRLTGLEREKIVAEFREVLALISKLQEILGSEKLVLDIIVEELTAIKKQFGDVNPSQPRHALNNFKWQLPSTLPAGKFVDPPNRLAREAHNFSRVFSGARSS